MLAHQLSLAERVGSVAQRELIERARNMVAVLPVDALLEAAPVDARVEALAAGAAAGGQTSIAARVMTQVFYCSTFFGAMTLSAAIDAGCFGAHDQRRLLIVSTNSPIPEITRAVDQTPGFDALRERFDEVGLVE